MGRIRLLSGNKRRVFVDDDNDYIMRKRRGLYKNANNLRTRI